MQKDKIVLIINPNASKGKGKTKAKEISSYFASKGLECECAYTDKKGHATALSKEFAEKGYGTIIAAGGDGTVNEVVNGIMRAECEEKPKMGIIPIGRGNDFAWIAKIPTSSIYEAADLIINGETKKTDVGFAKGTGQENGLYFFNGLGIGFEPLVNFRAQEFKHLNGMPSYIAGFIKILFNPPKGYALNVRVDDKDYIVKSQQLSANNGQRMGSTFMMTPLASIDDGLLDVMFTTSLFKGLGLLKLVLAFLRGAMVKDKKRFKYLKAKRVVIDSETNNLAIHVDGEMFTEEGQHLEIEIIPNAIELYR